MVFGFRREESRRIILGLDDDFTSTSEGKKNPRLKR
jgi:hypothetical protein